MNTKTGLLAAAALSMGSLAALLGACGSTTTGTGGGSTTTATSIPDGTYMVSSWTCGTGTSTKDIKAFALTVGIQEIDQTFAGATGSADIFYPAGCVRTIPLSGITYPTAGTVTLTTGGARTCTSSCTTNQCTAGTEPDVMSTYAFSTSGSSFTATRTLDAAFFTSLSLQSVAGCKAGDTEVQTSTKK